MDESTQQKVIPEDADDCARIISERRDEIAGGLLDIQIEKDWVRDLDEADLALLAKCCPSSRLAIASVTKAADLLELLARDEAITVREAVADNRKTPGGCLITLARDTASSVRMAVASNRNTPAGSLERLAADSVNYVRWSAASNEKTPPAALKALTKDPDKHVSDEARKNPSTPKAGLLARLLGKG